MDWALQRKINIVIICHRNVDSALQEKNYIFHHFSQKYRVSTQEKTNFITCHRNVDGVLQKNNIFHHLSQSVDGVLHRKNCTFELSVTEMWAGLSKEEKKEFCHNL